MAKASLTLGTGTKVSIEGTAEEVAVLLARFSSEPVDVLGQDRGKRAKVKNRAAAAKAPDGPTGLITELASEGYFKSKRSLDDVRKKLEERGHIYPKTSISPILTRLTKRRTIRRLKEKKSWVYVS